MEKCYDYFGCTRTECSMHTSHDNPDCREVDGTLCNSPGIDAIQNMPEIPKFNKCTYCIYRKEALSQLEYQKQTAFITGYK